MRQQQSTGGSLHQRHLSPTTALTSLEAVWTESVTACPGGRWEGERKKERGMEPMFKPTEAERAMVAVMCTVQHVTTAVGQLKILSENASSPFSLPSFL